MAPVYPDLDTPLLKVSRPVAACSRCRNAKIKCDGKLPACSACERSGRSSSCSGATDEFAKGKERSYVASLEAQCERLERQIAAARERQQGLCAVNTDSGSSVAALASGSNTHADASYGAESSDIDDLVGDFGFLAVNATSRDFYGIRASTSFAGLLLTVTIAEPLPRSLPRAELPPHSQVASLTLDYFDNFHPVIPFLSETKFWASVDAIYQDHGRFASSHDRWTLRMVLAISAASKSRKTDDQDSHIAMSHVNVALGYAEDVLKPGTIAGIQAILLLALYSTLDPSHFRTWYLIGIAARVATDLGIHQEHASETNMDKAFLDARRRTFHCVYSLDRYVSTALGRAFSFSDDSINVPLPSDPPLSAPSSQTGLFLRNIEPALFIFQIRHFQSAAYQEMFFGGRQASSTAQQICWERCSAAINWFQSCPKDLPDHFALLLHFEYVYTLILVLSPSNRSPTTSKTNQVLLFEYSISFISQIYNEIVTPTIFSSLLTYMDIERCYTVACKLLNLLRQSPNEVLQDASPDPLYNLHTSPPDSGVPPISLQPVLTGRHDCTNRALTCLYEANSIFEYAFHRWGMRALLGDFRRTSFDIKGMLSARFDQQQRESQHQSSHLSHLEPVRQSLSPEYQHSQHYSTGHRSQSQVQHPFHPDERPADEYGLRRGNSA